MKFLFPSYVNWTLSNAIKYPPQSDASLFAAHLYHELPSESFPLKHNTPAAVFVVSHISLQGAVNLHRDEDSLVYKAHQSYDQVREDKYLITYFSYPLITDLDNSAVQTN